MGDKITIEADLLIEQARIAEAAADSVVTARNAIASMNLGGGAFGVMCAGLVSIAQAVTDLADNSLREARAMLEREAAALRGTLSDFTDLEDNVSADLDAIMRAIR